MKNQYVGDINDYLKYALLRHVQRSGYDMTICWMRTPDDGRRDGRRRWYLDDPAQFRDYDPVLFDALAGPLRTRRNLRDIERSGLLPHTNFFPDLLSDDVDERSDYFGRFSAAVRTSGLVFFDPDNGLDIATVSRGRRNSSKYLYRDELEAVLATGRSCIVYQHFPRVERSTFLNRVLGSLSASCCSVRRASVFSSHVAYLIFAQESDSSLLPSARAFAHRWAPIARHLELPDDPATDLPEEGAALLSDCS